MESIAMTARTTIGLLVSLLAAIPAGCRKPVYFPAQPVPNDAGGTAAYDTDGDGVMDFFTFANADGRADRIGYDRTGDGAADDIVALDAVPLGRCRHLVIILDGFDYEVVADYYAAGGLRVFHKPSRVVAPYPTMTDVALEDVLGYMPASGFEAVYYDRRNHKRVGGAGSYLRGDNQPYNHLLQYRADLIFDVLGYVSPTAVFGKEINDAKRGFDRRRTQEFIAYFVSSAGVSTADGAEGQRQCLQRVERLVHQVIWESRGLVKVTLLADHGHSYTPSERIDLDAHLRGKGWRMTARLARPKDAVSLIFGLVTYAGFMTDAPGELAGDLMGADGVELVSFVKGDHVVCLGPDGGRAVIRRRGGGYKYEPLAGDPLGLKAILARVPADAEGYVEGAAMLEATIDHTYPIPLQRLWRAHFGLVAHPPDVIASLADDVCCGSASFGGAVKVASTHGGLNRRNSVTFIMSTAGKLPPAMQSADIPAHLGRLFAGRWPLGK